MPEMAGGDVIGGQLACDASHSFEIIRGIPRFVSTDGYAANFGFEWNLHSTTQLDTETMRESEESFIAKTGFTPGELRGKLVLDVGCGMGRFSDVASRWGASVVGVDLTSAIDAAQRNLATRRSVNLAQADIFKLPFAAATFDYVFSIGVLHHTPNTRAAFDLLPPLVKPGGKIAIWVYSSTLRKWSWSSDAYRHLTTRLPKRMLHRLCQVSKPLYYLDKLPVVGRVSWVLLPVSLHPDPDWRVLATFHWYSPKYQWKHSEAELKNWFERHGLVELRTLGSRASMQGTRVSG